MEQNVEIKKPDPNPRDMAAGEIVVNVQKTDENGVTWNPNDMLFYHIFPNSRKQPDC